MKKFFVLVISILVIVSFILGGCSSQLASPTAPGNSAPASSQIPSTSAAAPTTNTATETTSAPAQVFDLKFSHHNPPQGWTTVKFLDPWAQKVETATHGAVKITMYPAQTLATISQNYDAVINNLAQLTWIPSSPYQGRFPLSEVITLPFLSLPSGTLNGQKVPASVVNSYIIEELYETMPDIQKEWSQTKLLFLHTSSPFFLVTKKPVTNLDEMKGLKIAVLGSGPTLDMWKALGAAPVYITAPNVYQSGQKGVIDACSTNWANMGTYRLNEVFPYVTNMSTYVTLFAVVMNLDTWNKMPPQIQQEIMSVSGQAGAEFAATSAFGDNVETGVLANIKKQGSSVEIVSLDQGQLDQMKALAGKPIWDEWVNQLKAKGLPADKVLNAALNLVNKYK